MVEYNRYPAMDAENNFPPVVRQALSGSKEISEKIKSSVEPLVREELASDSKIYESVLLSAERAVDKQMENQGIVIGRGNYTSTDMIDPLHSSAYRHMTEDGGLLPLGYTAGGHLDQHAINIWTEDLELPSRIPEHPIYAKMILTDENKLLMGIRWDGKIDIPGNASTPGVTPSPGTPSPGTPSVGMAKMPMYQDAKWSFGSDVYPAFADKKRWSGWGSSSMAGILSQFRERSVELGVENYYSGGKGGEKSDHIAARLGSVPAKLTFPENKIAESGSTEVSSTNLSVSASLQSYTGWITATDGTRVHGTLSSSATALSFKRTAAGNSYLVNPDSMFVPEEGPKHRGDTAFLWMGKNNITQPDRVIADTDASYEYFVPLIKRVLVMGHFVNGGTPAVSSTRTSLLRVNETHKARYGDTFFDVQEYLMSSALWTDTGITPTAADLEAQAIGNKPESVSSDTGHMNAAGYKAVSNRVKERLVKLGWY